MLREDKDRWVGARFGRWTVIKRLPGRKALAVCDCGTQREIDRMSLSAGKSRSCGCLLRETTSTEKRVHGAWGTPEYVAWRGMLARCGYERSNRYGMYAGRGIKVCARWHRFECFLEDMGLKPSPEHSLERVDNNGDYEPGNCRWATPKEQARNRRSNLLVEYRGETKPLAEWVDELRLPYKRTWKRLRVYDWPVERAFNP